jgi:transposase-like protein
MGDFMTFECKHCGGLSGVKNGIVGGKQRYKCKSCSKTSRLGDERVRHGIDKKMKVIKCYLEGVGIRSIERLEGVSSPLIIHWIRQVAKIVKEKLRSAEVAEDGRNISILEVDELFSYCKKNSTRFTYGLLLIGTEIKLLTLK